MDINLSTITLGRIIFDKFPYIKVRYTFDNLSNHLKLSENINIDQLRVELDHIRTLRITDDELSYLKDVLSVPSEYIEYLRDLVLPEFTLETTEDNQFLIETNGSWKDVIFWESIIPSIISEIYYKSKFQDQAKLIETGTQKNMMKFSFISNNTDIEVYEDGTNTRFSGEWQDSIVSMSKFLPNFKGTSNIKLSMKHGTQPIDYIPTNIYQVNDSSKILQEWFNTYGGNNSTLSNDYDESLKIDLDGNLKNWNGFKHEDGDPIEFTSSIISYYTSAGIDPTTKTIVFAKNINADTIKKIHDNFKNKIKLRFSWRELSNDMGVEVLNMKMLLQEL